MPAGEAPVGEIQTDRHHPGGTAGPAGQGWEVGARQRQDVCRGKAGAVLQQPQVQDGEGPAGGHPAPSGPSAGRQCVQDAVQDGEFGQGPRAVCGLAQRPVCGLPEEAYGGARGEVVFAQAGQQRVGRGAAVGHVGYVLHAPPSSSTRLGLRVERDAPGGR